MLDIYEGYRVSHSESNHELLIISFKDYDEAYEIMLHLVKDGYMIQDLECLDDEGRYVLWFNEQ